MDTGYSKGYTEGYIAGQQNAIENLDVQYTYHVHEGSAGATANGCYTNPIMKQVISHYENYQYHPSVQDNDGDGEEDCPNCDYRVTTGAWSTKQCPKCYVTGQRPVYKSVVDYYALGCGKTEDTIESVTIKY